MVVKLLISLSVVVMIVFFLGGGFAVSFRYVVGVQDGNVDPIKCGMTGADVPALLSRQLATDGIVLNPPTPQPVGEEGQREKITAPLSVSVHTFLQSMCLTAFFLSRVVTAVLFALFLFFIFVRRSEASDRVVFLHRCWSKIGGHREKQRAPLVAAIAFGKAILGPPALCIIVAISQVSNVK